MKRRTIFIILGCLVLILSGALLWVRSFRNAGRPLREGSFRIQTLLAPVTVRWDRWGVPHVDADGSRDLGTALGFLHANDRFLQMELARRSMSGRLAECFGESVLAIDGYFRLLRLLETAQQYLDVLEPRSKAMLEGYTEGVNAWLDKNRDSLPPDAELLRSDVEPWRPVDSIGIYIQWSHDMSFSQGRPDEARFSSLVALDPSQSPAPPKYESVTSNSIMTPWLEDQITITREQGPVESSSQNDLPPSLPGGSQAIAIPGKQSTTGFPLLMTEPHLPFRSPSMWYQALLRSKDYEAMGATLPGFPLILFGQGENIAWSVTSSCIDVHDIFFEDVNDETMEVKRGDVSTVLNKDQVNVSLAGGESVPLDRFWTDSGPLLREDSRGGLPDRTFAWTGYRPHDPLRMFLELPMLKGPDGAKDILNRHACPSLHAILAYRDGTIQATILGEIPEREEGVGSLPQNGADLNRLWKTMIKAPQVAFFQTKDTPIIAANQAPEKFINPTPTWPHDGDTSHRLDRIRGLLADKILSPESLGDVTRDLTSLYALELVSLIEETFEGEAEEAMKALRSWSGEMSGKGPSALFTLFEKNLEQVIFEDEIQQYRLPRVFELESRRRMLALLGGKLDSEWFDNQSTESEESRQECLAQALKLAWQRAHYLWGPELSEWSYEDLHPLTFWHPLGGMPIIGGWFTRGPFKAKGSSTTPWTFGGFWVESQMPAVWGPSMRWISNPLDGDHSRAVLPLGQSGHPADRHFDDQTATFLDGAFHEVQWSEAAIDAATVSTLQLTR